MRSCRDFVGLAVCAVVLVLAWSAGEAISQPAPVVDTDKYRADLTLMFTDLDADGWHDPAETWVATWNPAVTDTNSDMSCWMASACNMLSCEGYGNPYTVWLGSGGAPSPSTNPWGVAHYANGGGNAFTFDDGGFQQWGLARAGRAYQGPIITNPEWGENAWGQDPVAWCIARLAEGHPVGLCVWWGTPPRGALPGPPPTDASKSWYYHAITLWDIDTMAGTLTITDSDDGISGARIVNYTYAANDWVITQLYTGWPGRINCAVALAAGGPGPGATGPALSEWGVIALVALLTGLGAWMITRRRREAAI